MLIVLSSGTVSNSKNNPEDTKPNFQVKLASYEDAVPIPVVEMLRQVDGLQVIINKNGTSYYSQPYNTELESERAMDQYVQLGFDKASQVVVHNNTYYALEDYKKIKAENSVIRIIK
jgi:hypothetical protein